jgi:UDP-N-acetylmuramoyl-L-alanyl-D-glutamate--2,6-diaminopimelate ligase
MKLEDVIKSIDAEVIRPQLGDNPLVTGVTHNSEWVQPGCIFVAVKGLSQDAHKFINPALENGAIAIVGEGFDKVADLPIPYLKVSDARQALGNIASLLHDFPSKKMAVIGVTGTKGKTTTAWLTRHLLMVAGFEVGLLSTLGYKLNAEKLYQFPTHFTTPEAPQIQDLLARMVKLGCTHVVVECSSEALALKRLVGTKFSAAVWTNLSPEHLNFHGTMEEYFKAKRILVSESPFSVLNLDDDWSMRLVDSPHTTYSMNQTGITVADWQALNIAETEEGLSFQVKCPQGDFLALLPLIGSYNISNALAAAAVAFYLGVSIENIQIGFSTYSGTPGRMQIVQDSPVRVILDFAHTPISLKSALIALRRTTGKKLIVVIGSAGGPRDPGKRAPLGTIATQLADLAIFTEEDCRYTPIEEILNEMKRGAQESGKSNFVLIPDRYEAIRFALDQATKGDTVVLCGKAGETTLERENEVIPWDEASVTKQILNETKKG